MRRPVPTRYFEGRVKKVPRLTRYATALSTLWGPTLPRVDCADLRVHLLLLSCCIFFFLPSIQTHAPHTLREKEGLCATTLVRPREEERWEARSGFYPPPKSPRYFPEYQTALATWQKLYRLSPVIPRPSPCSYNGRRQGPAIPPGTLKTAHGPVLFVLAVGGRV